MRFMGLVVKKQLGSLVSRGVRVTEETRCIALFTAVESRGATDYHTCQARHGYSDQRGCEKQAATRIRLGINNINSSRMAMTYSQLE